MESRRRTRWPGQTASGTGAVPGLGPIPPVAHRSGAPAQWLTLASGQTPFRPSDTGTLALMLKPFLGSRLSHFVSLTFTSRTRGFTQKKDAQTPGSVQMGSSSADSPLLGFSILEVLRGQCRPWG